MKEESITLDCNAAASLISVSRSTFWKLHNTGNLPLPLRLSSRVVRWRRAELVDWVKAGCPPRDKWTWKE